MSGSVAQVAIDIVMGRNTVTGVVRDALAEVNRVVSDTASTTQQKMNAVGGAFTNIGASLMPVSTAVKGVGIAAVKTTADFDSSMSKVSAISGATGEDFDKLRDKAREMGSKTKFSATESAEAMQYMAMAGWKTGDMLNGIEGMMNLAAASGEDLATTSDIVTDALTAMGYSASDSGRLADVMAAASSNANTNVSMMGETFKYAAPVAGALGYSMEDLALATGLMANSGIKASQAGTSLRGLFTRLVKPTDESEAAMTALGLSITDSSGKMKPLNVLIQEMRASFSNLSESEKAHYAAMLAGQEGMSGFLAIVNSSDKDFNKLKDSIDNSSGSAKKMADTMNNNLSGQLTILKSQLQEFAISIGDALMPTIKKVVSFVQEVVDKFNAMSQGQKSVIATIGLVVAAVSPLLIVIGKVVSGISGLIGVVGKVGGAFKLLSGVFTALTSPVGIAIAAVTALVGGFIYLWNTSEGFRNFWIGLWEGIKNVCGAVIDAICGFFTETLPNAWNSVVAFFSGIPEWWSGLWGKVGELFAGIWEGIRNNPVIQTVADTVTSIWENAKGVLSGIWNGIADIASGAWELIKNVVLAPVLLLIDMVTGNFAKLSSDAQNIWNNIRNAASNIWGGIKQGVVSLAEGLAGGALAAFEGLKNGVSSVWGSIKDTVSGTWSGIVDFVTGTASTLKDKAVSAFDGMASGIGKTVSHIGSIVSDGFQSAISFITSLPGKAVSWGADFINGLVSGIKSAVGNVVNSVSGVAGTIRSYLHFSVPDVGPLTDYESWMPDFMAGLARGIDSNRGLVANAVGNLAESMAVTPSLAQTPPRMRYIQGMERQESGSPSGTMEKMLSILEDFADRHSTGSNPGIEKKEGYEGLAKALTDAMRGWGVYMDGRPVGRLVARTVNEELGKFDRRRT